jgi:hypothetical protein
MAMHSGFHAKLQFDAVEIPLDGAPVVSGGPPLSTGPIDLSDFKETVVHLHVESGDLFDCLASVLWPFAFLLHRPALDPWQEEQVVASFHRLLDERPYAELLRSLRHRSIHFRVNTRTWMVNVTVLSSPPPACWRTSTPTSAHNLQASFSAVSPPPGGFARTAGSA